MLCSFELNYIPVCYLKGPLLVKFFRLFNLHSVMLFKRPNMWKEKRNCNTQICILLYYKTPHPRHVTEPFICMAQLNLQFHKTQFSIADKKYLILNKKSAAFNISHHKLRLRYQSFVKCSCYKQNTIQNQANDYTCL